MPSHSKIHPLHARIQPAVAPARSLWPLAAIAGLLALAAPAMGQLTLGGTSYLQTFDALGSGLPTGWSVRTGASATSLGNVQSFSGAATAWDVTTGSFRNSAAADDPTLTSASTPAEQSAATDRALAIRQTGTFGDPSAAFTLQLANTLDLTNFSLSFSAQLLSSQPRSTTWSVQYGLGSAPNSFTTLGTFADPGAFGATTLSFGSSLLSALDNLAQNVWIRVVALTASTGTGLRDTFGIDDFNLTYTRAAVTPDYWDSNGSLAGIGGSGTWDTVVENKPWNLSLAGDGAPVNYDPNHVAVFGGTSGTVTVAGTVTTSRGLQFDSNGYLLTGGTITFAGAGPSILIGNAANTATIDSVLAGTSGLTKDGAGTLILNGANTYTGGTTINAGTVSIATDANLGAGSSGLTLVTGTLRTTADLTLGAGRALTGRGSFDIAAGTTLQIAGSVSGLDLTLTNTGAIVFTGTTPTLAGLAMPNLVSVTATGGSLGIVGNLSTSHAAGTATLGMDLNFGNVPSAVRVISVANGTAPTDLLLSGNLTIAGASARLVKTGEGTLEIAGAANSISGGLRLGEAGLPAVAGGTLRIASPTAFGTGSFQGNAGTLVLLNPMTGASAAPGGLSIGANDTTPLVITGAPIDFNGASSLFVGGSTGYANKVVLETDVRLIGNFSGASASAGLIVAGPGSLTIASSTNNFLNGITVDDATLILTGTFTGATRPSLTLGNTATLRGGTLVAGISASDALIAPGTTTGEQVGTFSSSSLSFAPTTTLSLDLRSTQTIGGLVQYDRFVVSGSPLLDNSILTGTVLPDAVFAPGDLFFIVVNSTVDPTLGTFAGLPDNLLAPPQVAFTGPGGTFLFEISYRGDATSNAFDATAIGGNDVVLRALAAIPEPTSGSLLLGAFAGLAGVTRLRGRAQRSTP